MNNIENNNVIKSDCQKLKYQGRSVHCTAHTLQLAVLNVSKDNKIGTVINASGMCKKLRLPSVKNIFKTMQIKANYRLSYTMALDIGYVGTFI